MRSVPVGNVVDVALRGCGCNEIAVANWNVDDSVFEVQIFFEFDILGEDVSDLYSVVSVQVGLPIIVGDLLIDYLTDDDVTISTSSWTESTICWPY